MEALVGKIVYRDDAPPRNGRVQSRDEVVRAEHHVAVDQFHPGDVGRRAGRAGQARDLSASAQVERAEARTLRQIAVNARAAVGNASVAEEVELHLLVLRQRVQKVVEVPADAGQRLVKRPDVDADSQLPLLARRGADHASDPVANSMAQRLKDVGKHRAGGSYISD